MPLSFRPAAPADYPRLESLVIESFGPITWHRKLDESFGPFGQDWRTRWQRRFAHAFQTQVALVGETGGEIVAYASGNIDAEAGMGYIDLLAVDQRYQGCGYGRAMLRAMLCHMKERGAVHAHLECLADNDVGNALYRSEGFVEVARSIRWFIKIP